MRRFVLFVFFLTERERERDCTIDFVIRYSLNVILSIAHSFVVSIHALVMHAAVARLARQVETRLNERVDASSRLQRVTPHHRPHGTCLQAFSAEGTLVGSVWVLAVATCVDSKVFPRAAQGSTGTPGLTLAEDGAEQASTGMHTHGSSELDKLLLDRLDSKASEKKLAGAAPDQAGIIQSSNNERQLFFHLLLIDESQVVCGPRQTNTYLLRKGVGQGSVEASQVGGLRDSGEERDLFFKRGCVDGVTDFMYT